MLVDITPLRAQVVITTHERFLVTSNPRPIFFVDFAVQLERVDPLQVTQRVTQL